MRRFSIVTLVATGFVAVVWFGYSTLPKAISHQHVVKFLSHVDGWWNPRFGFANDAGNADDRQNLWIIGDRVYQTRDLMGRGAWLRWLNPISTAEAADIKGQKTEITVQQARQIQAAINALNQYPVRDKDGQMVRDAQGNPALWFYSFSPVATLVMAKDGLTVDQALRPVDEAQKKLTTIYDGQKKAAAATATPFGEDADEKFRVEKLQPLLDQKLSLELFRLKTSDLAAPTQPPVKWDGSDFRQPIWPAVVQALLPILDDDTK